MTTVEDLRFTIDEVVDRMPERCRWDIRKGELRIMSPSNARHGQITVVISAMLHEYVNKHDLGIVLSADAGFILERFPDTLLAPDVAFIGKDRAHLVEEAFFDGPPDLAVEVISPSESKPKVIEKAHDWLDGGTKLVCLCWPRTQTVTVFAPGHDERTLNADATLDGGDVLPGFSCPVGKLFA